MTTNHTRVKTWLLTTLAAGIWINLSEYVRNVQVVQGLWRDAFATQGLDFPMDLVANTVWALWSFIFAGVLAVVSRRFSAWQATLLVWLPGFGLLWLTLANIGLLSLPLLAWAAPWSLAEVWIAALICRYLQPDKP